jgi:hypothetical protein
MCSSAGMIMQWNTHTPSIAVRYMLALVDNPPRSSHLISQSCVSPLQAVQNNESVFLHVVFAKENKPLDPTHPEFDESLVFGHIHSKRSL